VKRHRRPNRLTIALQRDGRPDSTILSEEISPNTSLCLAE